jgi:hypothetical protein
LGFVGDGVAGRAGETAFDTASFDKSHKKTEGIAKMNYKPLSAVVFVMMLFPLAARAQVTTLLYSEGIFSGNVTLSAPLPENGTISVSPTEFNFPQVGFGAGYNSLFPNSGYSLGGMAESGSASFSFTTDDGRISAWGISIDFTGTPGTNTQTALSISISPGNDSFLQQSYGAGCTAAPGQSSLCQPSTFSSSSLGVWTMAAPELDPTSAAGGMFLLFGSLLVLCGRRSTLMPLGADAGP